MLVTLLGIVTEVKPLHQAKANTPMLVTLYVVPKYDTDEGITIDLEYSLNSFGDEPLYVTSAV